MKPGYLWLLLPLAAWCGYQTAPRDPADRPAPAPPAVPTWTSRLEKATATDLEAQLTELLATPNSQEWFDRLRLICARWAELDPAGALAYFAANKVPTVARIHLLAEWALLDSDAAWAAIPTGAEGDSERETITRILLNEDREIFMRWFRQVQRPMPDGNPAWVLLAESHGEELERIANALLTKATNDDGSAAELADFFSALAKAKATRDPAAAYEWAAKLDPQVRNAAIRAALLQWSERDPLEVWKRLNSGDPLLAEFKEPVGLDTSVGARILQHIAKEDPAKAVQMLGDASDGDVMSTVQNNQAIDLVFPGLLASGKLSAVEAYRLIASVKAHNSILGLNALPAIWGALSPEGLVEAARTLATEPPGEHLGLALGGVAGEWMKVDPAAAAAFISQIKDPQLRAEAYCGCFTEGPGSHIAPGSQAERLASIPAENRAEVFATYLTRYGDLIPGDARFTWAGPEIRPDLLAPVFKDLPPSPELNRSVTITTREWGQQDPAASLAWADSLADPAARQAAYSGTFEGWAFQNPHAAADWLADKPEGPERDAAALPLVRNLLKSDAEAAWQWSDTIGDSALRLDARIDTLRAWALRDHAAAQAAYRRLLPKLPAAEATKLSASLAGS